MTLLDEYPAPNRPPHLSWRDLPASPPVATFLPPPDPTTYFDGSDRTESMPRVIPPAPPTGLAPEDGGSDGGRRRTRFIVIGAFVAVLALGGTLVAVNALASENSSTSTPTVPSSSAGSPTDVAAALGPAVVQIEIGGGLDAGGGVGSGVIYDASGLVLTAHHVVASTDEVAVKTADGRTFTGRVVGRAPERDLAVVALDGADDLTAATIAEPDSVEVGEPAIALGSPFGYQASVTAGIISGLDRELETPAGVLTGLIQTDAPINPGNSGGPLADAEAKVIGINTAIASMSGGSDGVGFAVPVEDAKSLLEEVTANGGSEAPTVPAPEGQGVLDQILPGLDELIPGLDELIPGLEDLIPGAGELIPNLGDLPSLDQLLEDLFGDVVPEEVENALGDLLGDLFGDQPADQPAGESGGA